MADGPKGIALIRLEPQAIPATWPRIEQWVAEAAERSHGRYTAPLIKRYAEQGLWQIWIALDDRCAIVAVGGSKIVTYDTGLKAFVFIFGTGEDRQDWQHVTEEMWAWGKSQGCGLSEGSFRKGWRRVLPGWSHTHDFLERVL